MIITDLTNDGVISWIRGRIENCNNFASKDTYNKDGWLEDVAYYEAIIRMLQRLQRCGNRTKKVSDEEVLEIKRRCLAGELQKHVAADLGISRRYVSALMTGKKRGYILPVNAADAKAMLEARKAKRVEARA